MPYRTRAAALPLGGEKGDELALRIAIERAEDAAPADFREVGSFDLLFGASRTDDEIKTEIGAVVRKFIQETSQAGLDARSSSIAAAFERKVYPAP